MERKWLLFHILILICVFSNSIEYGNCSNEITLTAPQNIKTGKTTTYTNTTIYYDTSTSPIFTVKGTLSLINCKIIPLRDPVDLIHTESSTIILQNVTVINPVFNNTACLIDAQSSDITLLSSSFTGYRRSELWWCNDLIISDCSFNMTGTMFFESTNNLTITDTSFDLITNSSTTFFYVRFSDKCTVTNSSFNLPAKTAQRLGAWLTAVDFFHSSEIVFAGNDVRNAGKVFVANGCTDVVVRGNTLANDEYVNSELQITGGSKNVLIADNTLWNLHDSIEVYDHENITIMGNHVTTDVLGFYIKPSNTSAPTDVHILNNTQIGGAVSVQHAKGLVIDGNTFIDTSPIHLINSTKTTFTHNVLRNSTILNSNSLNTTINGNTILAQPGQEWYGSGGESTANIGANTVHILESMPPEISNIRVNPSDPLDNDTITITADITDETGLQNVQFIYSVNGGVWLSQEMISTDRYTVSIGPYPNATTILFYITAKDTSINENTRQEDNKGDYYKIQVLVFEPKQEPEPAQSLLSEPQIIDFGIPGYTVGSIIAGLASIYLFNRKKWN